MEFINPSSHFASSITGTNSTDLGKMMATEISTADTAVNNKRLFVQGTVATVLSAEAKRISEMELINPSSQFASSVTGKNSTDLGQMMATEPSTASAARSSIAATSIRISKRISTVSSTVSSAEAKRIPEIKLLLSSLTN